MAYERDKEKISAAAIKQAMYDQIKNDIKSIILKNDIWYVGDQSLYVIGVNQQWTYLTQSAVYTCYDLNSQTHKQIFKEAMSELKRNKVKAVNTFQPVPDDYLNLMSTERWLQPVMNEPYHPIFDVLIQSISGGKTKAVEHIEQCIVYKYIHPEEFRIPCICISGEGGVGKNMLVDTIFSTIFGSNQVASLGTEEAFGVFNGQMIGKTVVFVDEAIVDKTDTESLKRKVGNRQININVKYGFQGTVDNTAWFWLGGNGTNGALLLGGDTTDRRFSIITVDKNMMYWVGKHLGIEVSGTEVLKYDHDCVKWMNDNSSVLRDPKEVAKWLGHIISKWQHLKSVPAAFHDIDYQSIVDIQKSTATELAEMVFLDKDFTFIEVCVLYELYKQRAKQDGSKPKKRNNFVADINAWLKKNCNTIEERSVTLFDEVGSNLGRKSVFTSQPQGTSHRKNRDKYGTGNIKEFYADIQWLE